MNRQLKVIVSRGELSLPYHSPALLKSLYNCCFIMIKKETVFMTVSFLFNLEYGGILLLKTFKCFSVPLKQFLINKNFKYELVAIDPTSNKKFWLFFRTQEFNNALTEWRNNNPKFRTQ